MIFTDGIDVDYRTKRDEGSRKNWVILMTLIATGNIKRKQI